MPSTSTNPISQYHLLTTQWFTLTTSIQPQIPDHDHFALPSPSQTVVSTIKVPFRSLHRRKSRSTGLQTIFSPTFPFLSFCKSQLYCHSSSNSQFLRFPSKPFRWADLDVRVDSKGRVLGGKGRRGGVICCCFCLFVCLGRIGG